jgi:hypothetical protein
MSDFPATSSADALELATQSYEEFLEDIKGRIRSAQARAARAINAELIEVYWQIGTEIERRQPRPVRSGAGGRRGCTATVGRSAGGFPWSHRILAREPRAYAVFCRGLARAGRSRTRCARPSVVAHR